MALYEQNLKTLAEYYPKMDEQIENAKKDIENVLTIYEEVSYDGRRILKIEKDGKICYLNGKRNTSEPAEIWVERLGELQERAPIIMEGIGNETYLQKLTEKTEKRLLIIVYEPSLQLFLDFLAHISLKRMMKKHTMIFYVEGIEGFGRKEGLSDGIGRVLNYEIAPYTKTFITPNYDVLFPEESLEFTKICHRILSNGLIRFNTMDRYKTTYVKNLFRNMLYLCDGYKTTQLAEVIPTDIVGIVVAAGPSLNKNIQELKKAKGRAFIIATDTAMKPLLKAGIVPDMFAIVDGKKPLHLVQVEGVKEVPLLAMMTAASEILDYHTGSKFFANEDIDIVNRLLFKCDKNFGIASDGGSVATTAFSLLYKLGLKKIILVGQDLAYTNNRSHADGTFEEKMPAKDTSGYIMVDGNNGDKIPTSADFKIYLDWYNNFIKGCQKVYPEFRVINATEGGAKIEAAEVMTLKEAIEQECTAEVDIQACLGKLNPLFRGEDRQWLDEQLLKIPEECEELYIEANKTIRLYKKLNTICNKREIDNKAYKKLLKRLGKQVQKIESHEIYSLVETSLTQAQYVLKNEQMLRYDSVQKEGKEIARKGTLYMEMVAKCALVFKDYAENVFTEENVKKVKN